jgi:ankyrin repeat protein
MLPNSRFNRNNLPPTQPPLMNFVANRITTEQAQLNFFSAIEFAHENEFPLLCDRAISQGANVNMKNHLGQSAIECAIARGSLIILRCLFARGAFIPEINQNEEDILMDAASKGHADIVEFLITEGNMQNNAKDLQGMTALHRAALFGNTETIKILLEYGTSPDTLTNLIRDDVLENIFGDKLNEFGITKEGKNISPLMIATARQNYGDVNLLLDHQAKVDIGGVPPLLIAIKNNDAQMIEILSRAGAYSDHHPVLNEEGLIEYAIKNNISIECLECLLNENSGKINLTSQQILILLINSITKNRPDYLAVLLAAGMNSENDHKFQILFMNADVSHSKISINNILAYLNADNFEAKIKSDNIESISEISNTALNTYRLTEIGVFPPLANKILQVLFNVKSNNKNTAKEQLNFALAVELGKGDLLNKNLFPNDFLNLKECRITSEWLMKVKKKAELQFTLLHNISNEIIDKKILKFQELISVNYLKEHIQPKNNPDEIANILKSLFINQIGIPNDLANLIAGVFRSGLKFVHSLNQNNYQKDELALLAQKLITNLLNHSALPQAITANHVSAKFTEKLSFVLNENGQHLKDFYASPFEFIKKLENRHNLRPPEVTTLLKQLSLDLGFPSQFSMHIIKAWSDSIAKTRQLNQLNTLTAINQAHKYQFAISLLDAIETMSNYPYFFQERFLEQTLQQLKSWCNSQQTQAEFFSGKRPASDNDGPNSKRQRHQ